MCFDTPWKQQWLVLVCMLANPEHGKKRVACFMHMQVGCFCSKILELIACSLYWDVNVGVYRLPTSLLDIVKPPSPCAHYNTPCNCACYFSEIAAGVSKTRFMLSSSFV